MKLTQKTLFQCFDKSQKQSPVIIDDTDEDIIECKLELKPISLPEEIPSHLPDFLLPIHIRQEDKSPPNDIIPLLNQWKLIEFNDEISSDHLQNFSRLSSTINPQEIDSLKLQVIPIPSPEHQMELFQQYTNDDLSSYAQSSINWKSMFHSLQDYRAKAIEQNNYEQLPWTEIYRPRHSKTYLGSHTKQIRRLNDWFSYWTKKLKNEQPKKPVRRGRKRGRNNDDDNSDEDFIDDSSKITK